MRAWDLHDNCMTYMQPSKMPLRAQDLLERLTIYQLSTNYYYTVGFPIIWALLRPTHGSLRITSLIDIPKGFN